MPSSQARAARWIGAAILTAHGLLHLIAVPLAWRLGEPGTLRYADFWPTPGTVAAYVTGSMWLAAAIGFWVGAWMLIRERRRSWVAVLVAVALSMSLMAMNPDRLTAGLAVDALIGLVAMAMGPRWGRNIA
jgi:hypothetical protein